MRDKSPIEVGSVVFSRAGRDQGSYYLVIEVVDDNYVKIADGDHRRLNKPKLKKTKHLFDTGTKLTNIANKLISGTVVYDAEIYSALKKI